MSLKTALFSRLVLYFAILRCDSVVTEPGSGFTIMWQNRHPRAGIQGGIFKLLRSLGIDSHVSWRAGTTNLFLLGS